MWRNGVTHTSLVRKHNGTATRKRVNRCLIKTTHALTIWPHNCTCGHLCQNGNLCSHENLYTALFTKQEPTETSFNGCMVKESHEYIKTMKYHSVIEKEQTIDKHNLDGSQGSYAYAGWKKHLKRLHLYDFIYMTFLKWQSYRDG